MGAAIWPPLNVFYLYPEVPSQHIERFAAKPLMFLLSDKSDEKVSGK
jgi:hypothetical protein